jgi:uncharacterized protein (TIGR03437 family)
MSGGRLPTQLGGVAVLIDNTPAPLLFVSAGQVNFMVPSTEIPGKSILQLVRQSIVGPAVTISLVESAPALFSKNGYVLAQDYQNNNAAATPDAPAHSGDMIVLYCTGLGHTQPNPLPGEVTPTAAYISNLATLQVLLNGAPIDSTLIKYAGLTPFSTGLYQVNFVLPGGLSGDVEIRLSDAGQASAPGWKLAVR